MTEDSNKPISERSADELLAEMEEFFNYLGKSGEFQIDIFTVVKEIILRAGPTYEVYAKFGELQSLLQQIKDIGEADPEFVSLLKQATGIWKEVKDWYYE